MLDLLLLAQLPDSLAGGAGWAGAGLLGLVLSWLCLKHIPDKDKQISDLIAEKDKQVTTLVTSFNARVDAAELACAKERLLQDQRHAEERHMLVAELKEGRISTASLRHEETNKLATALDRVHDKLGDLAKSVAINTQVTHRAGMVISKSLTDSGIIEKDGHDPLH